MPTKVVNNDDQFKFLISCIRHSDNGKIDFQKVADECTIVTKAAAAKRYERMMKAHGIHPSQNSGPSNLRDSPAPSTLLGKATNKKRKIDQISEPNGDDIMDDEDSLPTRAKIKKERKNIKLEAVPKDADLGELPAQGSNGANTDVMVFGGSP
ncbi:MAG: hypothetical protein Q9164_002810 [Protoblastenia rupestris]